MAKTGTQVYITNSQIIGLIRLCRAQTDQIWLDYADKLEEIARKRFPGIKIPARQPVQRGPVCPQHHKLMHYDEHSGEHVCPEFGCAWRAYEDEEPDTEGAHVYHQDVAEKTRDAAHGSTRRGKKRNKPRRGWKQDEGSPNAWGIKLKGY